MSATLAPQTTPLPVDAAPALEVVGETVDTPAAEAEMHRWLIFLGTPFVLGAVFFALSIATSAEWLIGVAVVLGPLLFILMSVYLMLSSDSNAAPELHVTRT